MEDVDNSSKNTKPGFINHVFNFDTETKNDLLNIGQYLLLALVPMALYNHLVDSLIPEPDESKGNLELLGEDIRTKVWDKYKIKLEWEIIRIGKHKKI